MTEHDLIELFESIDIDGDDNSLLPNNNTLSYFSQSKNILLVNTLKAIKYKVIYLTPESALHRILKLKEVFCYIPATYSNKESKLAHMHEQKVSYEVYTAVLKFFGAYEKKLKASLEIPSEKTDSAKILEIVPSIIFKPESIPAIYNSLKNFFSSDDQIVLHQLLITGQNAENKLIFLDKGNRLADAFKQLIKTDLITGCNQKELEAWIKRNFLYRKNNHASSFTKKYLNDIISTNKDLCANPIINVKKGIIEPL